jgi:hypothetical protein
LKREGYPKRSFDAGDVMEFATFPEFWLVAAKYWQPSLEEVLSFVEQSYLCSRSAAVKCQILLLKI